MKKNSRIFFGVTAFILTSCLASPILAQKQNINCPDLTSDDALAIIDAGTISTDQGYTLADEAGISRAQVLINESTANPFDTYYEMMGSKNINNQEYFIYVGNVLGSTPYEAKDRAKKILLGDEKVFSGKYYPENFYCNYKEVHASHSTPNYPFKSTYESVVLNAVPIEVTPDFMRQMMMKKRHA